MKIIWKLTEWRVSDQKDSEVDESGRVDATAWWSKKVVETGYAQVDERWMMNSLWMILKNRMK